MAGTALYVLLAATAVAAVQVGFLPPSATSYIYRSDNNGLANYIPLRAPTPHHGPHNAFVAPPPLAQTKLSALEAYDLAPLPLPYVGAKPIIVEDEEDDGDYDEDSDEYIDGGEVVGHDHGHAFAKGEGSNYGAKHHSAHGEKGSKGFLSKRHHANGEAGHYGKEHDEGYHKVAEGGEKGHHNEAAVHGKHYEAGESYKGGDHGHKKHHSKGEEITGYHKVFNKDEFKKDHDFYDVADNSGHFNKHGYQKAHHGSEKGGHKEGGHQNSAFNKGGFGKAGFQAKGHVDDADAGHFAEQGLETQYHDEARYGNKRDSDHGNDYAYADEDAEDEDDDGHYDEKE